MEKRIGAAIILIENKDHIDGMNTILSMHSTLIVARQGVPLRDKGISVITVILEGTTDQISSLTGKLGRLEGVQVKSVLTKYV
ncbi:MAG TPA: CopG family transcriptional regulator [Bacteroidales bacterium]|jgi:putative iron-only hydrogenase system regulator|nr:CopG family transcriptional regulator [Bacteroidales bacterium]